MSDREGHGHKAIVYKSHFPPLRHSVVTETPADTLANKKVLLRECKRHTARCVAIAISCYSRGGVPQQKIFFSSLNIYQAKCGVKKFSLYWLVIKE